VAVLVWACLAGLLIVVKVITDNKGVNVQQTIRSHYLKPLIVVLQVFLLPHLGGLLRAQGGRFLVGTHY